MVVMIARVTILQTPPAMLIVVQVCKIVALKTCSYVRKYFTKMSFVVDGGWSSWNVGNCSEECGGGVKEKFRICNNPAPFCGGKECSGMKVETVECNEFSCDSEGMLENIISYTVDDNKFIILFILCYPESQ